MSFLNIVFVLYALLQAALADTNGCPPPIIDPSAEIRSFEIPILRQNGRPYRPPQPLHLQYETRIEVQGQTHAISRHHIIPYSVLRDFWNNIIRDSAHFTRFGLFLEHLTNNALMFYQGQGFITQRIHEAYLISQRIINGRLQLPTDHRQGVRTLQMLFVWMPGNIFFGARNRADDPGDNFEIDADLIVGTENRDRLHNIYDGMLSYNEQQANRHELVSNIVNWLIEIPNVLYISLSEHYISSPRAGYVQISWDPSDGASTITQICQGPTPPRHPRQTSTVEKIKGKVSFANDPLCLKTYFEFNIYYNYF